MTTSRQTKGYINGVLASVSYGTNPLFALPLYACGIGASSVLFFRYFIATLIYYFWLKFVKKISLKINKNLDVNNTSYTISKGYHNGNGIVTI